MLCWWLSCGFNVVHAVLLHITSLVANSWAKEIDSRWGFQRIYFKSTGSFTFSFVHSFTEFSFPEILGDFKINFLLVWWQKLGSLLVYHIKPLNTQFPSWTNLDLDQCMIDLNQHPNHIYNQKLPILVQWHFLLQKLQIQAFRKRWANLLRSSKVCQLWDWIFLHSEFETIVLNPNFRLSVSLPLSQRHWCRKWGFKIPFFLCWMDSKFQNTYIKSNLLGSTNKRQGII